MKHISGKAIAFSDARREERVSGVQLAKEIKPLFDEYFLGVTACGDGAIIIICPTDKNLNCRLLKSDDKNRPCRGVTVGTIFFL